MQLKEVFACQKRKAKMALCGGGGLDVSWPRASARDWPRPGQTKNNSTVGSLNGKEGSLLELWRQETDQRKTVVVRPRGVEGDDSREKVREERESAGIV